MENVPSVGLVHEPETMRRSPESRSMANTTPWFWRFELDQVDVMSMSRPSRAAPYIWTLGSASRQRGPAPNVTSGARLKGRLHSSTSKGWAQRQSTGSEVGFDQNCVKSQKPSGS